MFTWRCPYSTTAMAKRSARGGGTPRRATARARPPRQPARCGATPRSTRWSTPLPSCEADAWQQMKTSLTLPLPARPRKSIAPTRVREAIGPDIALMCDINQRWRPEQAIDIGKPVEDAGIGLFWLEDVTTHDDYAGIARVNAALATPICGGELVYGVSCRLRQ